MRKAGAILLFILGAAFFASVAFETLPLTSASTPMAGVAVGQIVIGIVSIYIGKRLWKAKKG